MAGRARLPHHETVRVGARRVCRGGGRARDRFELDLLGVVQVSNADIAARLTAIRVVERRDFQELVCRSAGGNNRIDQEAERLVGSGNAIVRRSGVILNLLQANDVR